MTDTTPTKRPRLDITPKDKPSTEEIWKWTMTSESVAPCLIRDVFSMVQNVEKDTDFYWLGRVPCRSVRLVGLVVGVQVYERRIVYSVDDGTGVIDCAKKFSVAKTSAAPPSKGGTSKPPSVLFSNTTSIRPTLYVGALTYVVGKVVSVRDTRQIVIDQIERCSSWNDEPRHLQEVRTLRQTHYSLDEPFVIPPAKQPEPTALPEPSSSCPLPPTSVPPSPSTTSSCSSRTSMAPSPAKSTTHQSPPRLRHPSKLHSHHLTANTFRIYLKHYMDGIVREDLSSVNMDKDMVFDDPFQSIPMPATPTRPTKKQPSSLKTPQSYKFWMDPDQTPRAFPKPKLSKVDPSSKLSGFTLSYLRRVPVLADMAKRVVKAEAKRRLREEQKKATEAGGQRKSQSTSLPPDKVAGKMKRLFEWAVIQLAREGSIIIWEGPKRPINGGDTSSDLSKLWKTSSSISTSGLNSTLLSESSRGSQAFEDELGELSDPNPDEEAYLPLTATYLSTFVEKAISELVTQPVPPLPKPSSARIALGSLQPSSSGAEDGVTKEQVLARLKRDDQWRNLGEWHIEEALVVLNDQGRIWTVGRGRWTLTD